MWKSSLRVLCVVAQLMPDEPTIKDLPAHLAHIRQAANMQVRNTQTWSDGVTDMAWMLVWMHAERPCVSLPPTPTASCFAGARHVE